jgi:hypothetical protein
MTLVVLLRDLLFGEESSTQAKLIKMQLETLLPKLTEEARGVSTASLGRALVVRLQGSEAEECSVCLEPLMLSCATPVTKLPCNHMLHVKCFAMLPPNDQACPLCRELIPEQWKPTRLETKVRKVHDKTFKCGAAASGFSAASVASGILFQTTPPEIEVPSAGMSVAGTTDGHDNDFCLPRASYLLVSLIRKWNPGQRT